MKRYLKHDRYRLEERQAESLWYAVRRELKGSPDGAPARHRAWRPALAVATLATVSVLAVGWWFAGPGSDAVRRGPAAGREPVVALEHKGVQAAPAARPGASESAASPGSGSAATGGTPAGDAAPSSAPEPAAEPAIASTAVASAAGVITGRVVDQSDGSAVAGAGVLLVGTTRGVATDSTGTFRFEGVEPGRRVALQVVMLGYAPLDVAVDLTAGGEANVACGLEPIVVAVAPELAVEGEEYQVAVRSAVTEHQVTVETFEKYAIESVEQALKDQAGVVFRGGEVAPKREAGQVAKDLGGLRNRFNMQSRSPVRVAPPAPGSITGGTTPPNGERFESMYFEHAGVNPFVATDDDALSTFALDVDNASFSLARSYLDRGELPPAAAIRVEEYVNAIDAGWPPHGRETFRLGIDGGPSRFGEGYHLLRVGVVARSVEASERKPANLVFVIDVSGSMGRENRLGAVKRALRVLVDELDEGDRVGIVTYGSLAEVRLPLVDASRRDEILEVIEGLRTTGATNAAAGLELGYGMARRSFERGIINRVVLCSDGVANAGGATDADGILELARRGSDDGITLSTVGFGMGNYNDVLMERLANDGDGNYFYVDGPREAERVFRENLTGLLQTVARQAKVQVEFDPRRVSRWRLLGYENRDVADRDFRNDAIDAGEVGAGHQVTALYELKLVDPENARDFGDDDDFDRLGTVRLRWEAPEHDTAHVGKVTETEAPIRASLFAALDRDGTPHRRAQALAAEFAEILRGSYWAKESRLSSLVPIADGLARELSSDQAVQDLARMIRRAAVLGDAERDEDDR
ncbi:MAG: von Willebrand factor type A domain-containing protein [bacterium]|nr:von Willebrand factor type A domain-containing protein [bacterium]